MVDQAGTRPLAGVVVLDLSQFLAGPNGTQILADMGARVIKVEPAEGDSSRGIPPHYVAGLSAYFVSTNRSKESIVVDLKSASGRAMFLRLVESADVVIENFRPGVVERLGISYDDVAAVNPRAIYCSISGFGSDGPDAKRPAYDIIVQAMSGVMSVNGEAGRPPARIGVPIGDLAAGMFAAIGIVSALHGRRTTGVGQRIEVSMLQTLRSMLSYLGQYYLTAGVVAGPQGGGHVSIPTYRSFRCADDQWVVIAANTEQMWVGLCAALGFEELCDDHRFSNNQARLTNQDELHALLDQRFATLSSVAWLELLYQNDVPAAPIKSIDQTLDDAEHAIEPGVVRVHDESSGEDIGLLASPIKLSGAPIDYRFAPRLGEHTFSVLEELTGMSPEHLRELAAAGTILASTTSVVH